MAVNKKMVLLIAGSSAQGAGQTMQYMDSDNVGLDDKVGKALELTGRGVAQYASGNVKGWRDTVRLAGQTLIDLADDPNAG